MIKFITEEKHEKELTFKMVEKDQFFISDYGFLCQKNDDFSFIIIANEEGVPYCNYRGMPDNTKIQKILPKVIKIEFGG